MQKNITRRTTHRLVDILNNCCGFWLYWHCLWFWLQWRCSGLFNWAICHHTGSKFILLKYIPLLGTCFSGWETGKNICWSHGRQQDWMGNCRNVPYRCNSTRVVSDPTVHRPVVIAFKATIHTPIQRLKLMRCMRWYCQHDDTVTSRKIYSLQGDVRLVVIHHEQHLSAHGATCFLFEMF